MSNYLNNHDDIKKEVIIFNILVESKKNLFEKIATNFLDDSIVNNRELFLRHSMHYENIRSVSTATYNNSEGEGFATPHFFTDSLNQKIVVFVKLKKKIIWDKEGGWVDMVFLLAGPYPEEIFVVEPGSVGHTINHLFTNSSGRESLRKINAYEELLLLHERHIIK